MDVHHGFLPTSSNMFVRIEKQFKACRIEALGDDSFVPDCKPPHTLNIEALRPSQSRRRTERCGYCLNRPARGRIPRRSIGSESRKPSHFQNSHAMCFDVFVWSQSEAFPFSWASKVMSLAEHAACPDQLACCWRGYITYLHCRSENGKETSANQWSEAW